MTFTLNKSVQFQKIIGFGGAMTDAASITIASLSAEARDHLINSYFAPEGIVVDRALIRSEAIVIYITIICGLYLILQSSLEILGDNSNAHMNTTYTDASCTQMHHVHRCITYTYASRTQMHHVHRCIT